MSSETPTLQHAKSAQILPVFQAQYFRVHNGANYGDPIAQADEIERSDIYRLEKDAAYSQLSVDIKDTEITIADISEIGCHGAPIHLDCVVTLMSLDGSIVEALVLIETDRDMMIEATYLLPLAPLKEKIDYALICLDRENARTRLAEVSCVFFTRGTLITLANGMPTRIEDLNVGDQVLTRDRGPQAIRWIGHKTVRAIGDFAPIIITKGAMNNEEDLIVSPNHRIFIYRRNNAREQMLVKASLLVNGSTIIQSEGGFVEYYQLLFDNHEIIYAEGIAAESMFIDTQVRPYLPAELQSQLTAQYSLHKTA